MDIREFGTGDRLAVELAAHVSDVLVEAIAQKSGASLVVSGGTTPTPFFNALARRNLSWERVVVTLSDERWVDATDANSNERLVREHLLKEKAAGARFVGLKNEATDINEGLEECRRRLADIPMPFDIVILGMGGDGHTASLFPGASELGVALDLSSDCACAAITSPTPPRQRLTLTLPRLLRSREIIVHITGREKRLVLGKALSRGPIEKMPVRGILRQEKVPVSVWWAP